LKDSGVLCIFEDDRYPHFLPISLNKPVFELMLGTQTIMERIVSEINPSSLVLVCREYLQGVAGCLSGETEFDISINELPDDEILFINGRLLTYEDELTAFVEGIAAGTLVHKNGIPVIARLGKESAASFFEFLKKALSNESVDRLFVSFKGLNGEVSGQDEPAREELIAIKEKGLREWASESGVKIEETGAKLLSYYWQLIGENDKCIVDDFQKIPLRGSAPESALFKGVDLINEEDIIIGADVEVRSGTVLDASGGPVIIADGASIEPNSIIYGPCYIGEGTIVRGGAKIGKGTSIGRFCRIGGEVAESIIASFTNKQHEGFLGHSYIGSWVNIGAGSCNSDLKNNYGKIRAWNSGKIRETGKRFLGLIAGDHAKIAINTRMNTGSVAGFCSNVMTVGFPPKFIPSFTWQAEPEMIVYELDKAVRTAEIMMDRRNQEFTSEISELFKALYRLSRMSGFNS
jgi:UDP-N-acetylglucosamine diphosphorylase/glucosamine-1-phosphate N-acetyltransferase